MPDDRGLAGGADRDADAVSGRAGEAGPSPAADGFSGAGDATKASAACDGCALHLERSGLDLSRWDHMIALSGNPNTGKSTLFNAMTGLRQHVGNWPGKTVARAEGGFALGGRRFKVGDLPGT